MFPATSHAEIWVNPQFDPLKRSPAEPKPVQRIPAVITAPIPTIAETSPPPTYIEPIIQPVTNEPEEYNSPEESKWSGRVNFGASLQTGNTEKNAVLADAELKSQIDDEHRVSIKAEYNREKDEGTLTENNRSADIAYDYFFEPEWFVNSTAGFEQDDIQQLDLRTTLGVGLGYQPYKGDDLNLQMILGPSHLREDFENGDTENSIAARWSLDYDQKVMEDQFQLFHNHEILIPADKTDSYLFESKSGIRIPIKNGIVGTGEIDFDWDNSPEPGVTEDDTKYSLKIGYEW